MDSPAVQKFTYDDYRQWPDDERYELVDGRAYSQSCASPAHQAVCLGLASHLLRFFQGQGCQVFTAPLDVKLSETDVVQPDVLVVCNPHKVSSSHIEGAPTLVIEVLSPSSLRHDRIRKFRLYSHYQVPEYWIVSPNPPMVEVHQWAEGSYRTHGVYTETDSLTSAQFPTLSLDLGTIFPSHRIDEVREIAQVPSAAL